RVPAEAVLHAAPPRARRGGDYRRRRAAPGPHVGRGAAVVPGDRRRGAVPRGLRLERLLRAPPLHARQARATAAVRRHPAVQLHLLAAAAPAPGHGAAGHDRARGAVPPHAAFVHARHRHHGRGEVSVADDPHAADAPAGGRARGAVAPAAGRRPAWTAAPAPGEPFVLGVNYWPRRKAMWWWRGFDDAEVDEELALVASLGLELVRVFLLWDDFQPAPDTVSRERLAELERLCDLAERHGLGLAVTFFTGHMSGPNWAPRWSLLPPGQGARPGLRPPVVVMSGGEPVDAGYRDPYQDPMMRRAEELLVTEVV